MPTTPTKSLSAAVLATMLATVPASPQGQVNPFAAPETSAPEDIPASRCIALARDLSAEPEAPAVRVASLDLPLLPATVAPGTVDITFATHSTYVIETPGGVSIATDYAGWAGPGVTPRVVTMNRAHSSHFTMNPDPRIEHVLPGWGSTPADPAAHALVVDDVFIRNVTTDIDRWGERSPNANSIFIFEVGDLCIGHLGHLHHRLADRHYAQIGRLDVVMVPVDGGLTLNHDGMAEIVQRLRASIILPMHRRGNPLSSFVSMLGDTVDVRMLDSTTITVDPRNLPERPTLMVMPGI